MPKLEDKDRPINVIAEIEGTGEAEALGSARVPQKHLDRIWRRMFEGFIGLSSRDWPGGDSVTEPYVVTLRIEAISDDGEFQTKLILIYGLFRVPGAYEALRAAVLEILAEHVQVQMQTK